MKYRNLGVQGGCDAHFGNGKNGTKMEEKWKEMEENRTKMEEKWKRKKMEMFASHPPCTHKFESFYEKKEHTG